jgi:hypothetical protein
MIDFPAVDGVRGSTRTAKAVLAAAAAPVDPALARRIGDEPDWRRTYHEHFRALLEAGLGSAEAAVRIAEAGLDALHRELVIERDGEPVPLAELDKVPPRRPLGTEALEGRGPAAPGFTLPYRGARLRGDDLLRHLDGWVERGVIEPGAGDALAAVARNPDWTDLRDVMVVALGAGAEMAPVGELLGWGARVVAVDLPRDDLWRRIMRLAEPTNGTLTAVRADLLADLPEVLDLLAGDPPTVIGGYAYADGGAHVRLNAACDAVYARVLAPGCTLATLATPTDVFAVPADAVEQARARYRAAARATRLVLKPTYAEPDARIVDSYVLQQGPNYALAKALQRWRGTVARARGIRASQLVAPMTVTRSVTRNRLFAAAYAGTTPFGVEVFAPATSRAISAAMLVHDLRHADAAANPGVPVPHPYDPLAATAVHGGLWRAPWSIRSALPLAVVAGGARRLLRRQAR